MSTSPVPPGVVPDGGADAAHRGVRGPADARPLVVGAGLVGAVLAGALGGLLATGHRVPDAAALLAVAALVLVPAVLVARSPRRAAARAVVVAGCALLAVGLHPVLVALTAPPGAPARPAGHAAHHGAAPVPPPAAAPAVLDEPRTWAQSVAAVDLTALAAAGVDLAAVRDAGYDLAALAAAGLDATTLAAAGADPADEHAPHHVAEAVAAAPDDVVAGEVAGAPSAREGQRAATAVPDGRESDAAAGPDGRADGAAAGPEADGAEPVPGRALALRLAAGTATALLAGALLLHAGRASHPRGGDRARVVTS
ncbi:hypothetical protein LFM56_00965 [Cellulomonas iranensis]|uniref:hypothetical protein n=1 Tax=Cellulomonas iranensis TaxID=76862 RepID=UPI001CF1764C|nr:hypothetical protein [Cellulomonas iranensis]UCN14930.1 hypothetical protein LFM56_00965 [Cellulomonas iranensis]